MLDLPMHEAAVAVLRHFADAALFPPGLYARNLGQPNQMFHLVAWALSYAVPVSTACRIVVAAAMLAMPLAAARLADHLGATRWSAVLASSVALGWLFVMGLVANLLGLVSIVALLPSLDRFVERPTARGAAGCAVACFVLYFAHEAMLLVYAGALLLFAALQPLLRARDVAFRAVPLASAFAIAFAQVRYQAAIMTPSVQSVADEWLPLRQKLVELPLVLFAPFDVLSGYVIFALAAAAAASLAVARVRSMRQQAPPPPPAGVRARLHAMRFELLDAALWASYFAFPVALNGANLVHQRFVAPAFALAALCAGRLGSGAKLSRLAPALACAVPVAVLLVTWPAFADSSRDHADALRLVRRIEPASAIAVVGIVEEGAPVDLLQQPMAAVAVGERGGRALYSLVESTLSPVTLRREWQWNEPVARILTRGEGLCPSYDLTRFRYVFVHAPQRAQQVVVSIAMRPEGSYVARAGVWMLYESGLPRVPLLSRDGPGPGETCAGGTLLARMHQVRETLRARAVAGQPLPDLPPE